MDQLSREGAELRIAITQALVQVHLQSGTPEALSHADSLVAHLEQECGDRAVVLLMRLELLQCGPLETFDTEVYAKLLRRLGNSLVSNDKTFALILYHVKQLSERNYRQACQVLDALLNEKLKAPEKHSWLEKAVITRIFMAVQNESRGQDSLDLSKVLHELADDHCVLGPEAAMAGQSVRTPIAQFMQCSKVAHSYN